MLDKILNDHLDVMEKIESDMEKDIDSIISKIDIDEILIDAQAELDEVVAAIMRLIEDEYIPQAIDAGQKLSQDMGRSKRDIIIQDTKDTTINEGLVDDKNRD